MSDSDTPSSPLLTATAASSTSLPVSDVDLSTSLGAVTSSSARRRRTRSSARTAADSATEEEKEQEASLSIFGRDAPVTLVPDATDPALIFTGLAQKLDTIANKAPFETADFRVQGLIDLITENVGTDGELTSDPTEFGTDLANYLARGLSEARVSDDPHAVTRFKQTIGTALHFLADTGNLIEGNAGPTVQAVGMATEIILHSKLTDDFADEDISQNLEDLFASDLQELSERELPIEAIQRIRQQFDAELLKPKRSEGDLTRLRAWVLEHVATPTLREALILDIVAHERRVSDQQDSTVRPIPIIRPLTSVRAEILSRPVLSEFSDSIGERVGDLRETLATTNGASKVIAEARLTVDELNRLFAQRGIREGVGRDSKIIRLSKANSAVGFIEEFERIAADVFGDTQVMFTYIPQDGVGGPQDSAELVRELKRALDPAPKRRDSPMIAHPMRTEHFGKIQIMSEANSARKEIVVPPDAEIVDIMKLAASLIQESGLIQDRHGQEELKITKGVTKVGEVISFIRTLLKNEGGHMARILYTPDDSAGGHFVGGALMALYRAPLLPVASSFIGTTQQQPHLALMHMPFNSFSRLKKVGGAAKVSDVALGIGGIAGGVAAIAPPLAIVAAPIAAVGAIIGGIGKLFGF